MDAVKQNSMEKESRSYASALWVYVISLGIAMVAGILLDRVGPKPAMALVFMIPLVLLGIKDFRLICAGAIFLLPFVPTFLMSKTTTGLSGLRVMTAVLSFGLLSLFFTCALRPRQVLFPRLPAIFLLYLAVVIFGALNGARFTAQTPEYLRALGLVDEISPSAYLGISLFIPLLVVGASLAVAILAANTDDSRLILFPTLAAAVILGAIICVFAAKGGSSLTEMAGQDSRRYLSGTGLHANEIGLVMNMALAIMLFVLASAPGWKMRIILGCCSLVLMGAIFVTFSRGAFIGTAVLILYFLFVQRRLKIILPILVILGSLAFFVPSSMIERTSVKGGNNVDEVSSGRVDEIWLPLIPSVLKNPIIGNGHGSILWSDAAKERKILPVGHPHSAYLGVLLDVGAVGTVIVLAFLAHVWRTLWRQAAVARPRVLAAFFYGASACVPILLVQGLTDDSFMPRYTHAFLWIAYGAALGLMARRHRGTQVSIPSSPRSMDNRIQ